MKKKLLCLSLSAAMLSLAVMPSVAFGDTSNASVSVGDDGVNQSISLGASVSALAFTDLTAYSTNDSSTKTPSAAADYIMVVDHDGSDSSSSGWYLDISQDDSTWVYSGSSTDGVNLTSTTNATPSTDQIVFKANATTFAYNAASTKSGVGCTRSAIGAGVVGRNRLVKTLAQTLIKNMATCPGTDSIGIGSWYISGPSNGLREGSYSQGITLTLYNGYNGAGF